jgi:hypothetical protein
MYKYSNTIPTNLLRITSLLIIKFTPSLRHDSPRYPSQAQEFKFTMPEMRERASIKTLLGDLYQKSPASFLPPPPHTPTNTPYPDSTTQTARPATPPPSPHQNSSVHSHNTKMRAPTSWTLQKRMRPSCSEQNSRGVCSVLRTI